MAQSIVSQEELLENAYQIAERNGVSALSVRGLANAAGVSVGTVYRHFSAKDELTTATIQLYFKHAFYERFCHIDPQVGFVDYCREMHASMRPAHPGVFYGTGDVFASALAALLVRGAPLSAALETATALTDESICRSLWRDTPRRFGVDFEGALPAYIRRVEKIFEA